MEKQCFINCDQSTIDAGNCDCVTPKKKPEIDSNYFISEINLAKSFFDFEDFMNFQMKHDVQIIRGEDYQYGCYIDKKCYNVSLTFFGALALGIKIYKQANS